MKKLFAICVLALISSLSYAKTCPSPSEIFVTENGQVKLVVPSGWILVADQRASSSSLNFSVAAWGDHNHDSDWMRCHYYKGSDHVQLSSNFQVTEAEITSHAEWGRIEDHYYLCTNSNVNGCPFG